MAKLTLSFKGRVIDVFHIKSEKTKIGRDEDCTIPIDSLAIAPVQVVITRNDDQSYLLQAQEEAFPVLVNHEKTEETLLNHGDVIQVGKHTLSFSEDVMDLGADLGPNATSDNVTAETEPDDNDESQANSGILQIINGDNFGRIIPLKRNMTRIGHTGGNCAIIAKREDGYIISFLEGTDPPLVNKKPIGNQAQMLKDGDIIELDGTQMQYHD
jgi:pSer/pThr/pTyr-binding forkhead associated (FHA) protein